MIKTLIDTYGTFDDSICNKIVFCSSEKKASVVIYCFNKKINRYENIEIFFLDILDITITNGNFCNSIFIEERENVIIFDFDPIDHFDFLAENPQSEQKIICKKIKFEKTNKEVLI